MLINYVRVDLERGIIMQSVFILLRRNKTIVVLGAIGAALIIALWVRSAVAVDTVAVAHEILQRCAQEESVPDCYEREVPALYPTYTVSEVLDVVRQVRREDSTYRFCHVLAHKLGERVVAEDMDAWIEAIPLNPPDGLCSNGFIHGVIGGRFRAEVLDRHTIESLLPDFSRACEARPNWKPSRLDQAICYHGMGHLYMYVTDVSIPDALSLCEKTAAPIGKNGDFRRVCREGVFMQIYQPLEPDDFLLIERLPVKPTAANVRTLCSAYVRNEYEGACLRESWPLFQESILTKGGIGDFCARQPDTQEEKACYQSASAIIGRSSLNNFDQAEKACDAAPRAWQPLCYETVARAIVEEDRDDGAGAASFCVRGKSSEVREYCEDELARLAEFIYGSDSRSKARYCKALPLRVQAICAEER